MAERSIVVRLKAEIAGFKAAMADAASSSKKVGEGLGKSSKEADTALGRIRTSLVKNRDDWDRVGRASTLTGAAMGAALGLAGKAAVDWETAWTGVTKTVSGSKQQLAELEQGLRDMAKTLPASHEEIAAVAEAAGQLGIKTPNVLEFTRTMIDLGNTTNLSADEAATAIARFANVMGTSQQEFDNIGSAIVGLGNNYATTEAEITAMSQRLAGAGHQIGLSEGDVLGLATALSSVGIEAEAGGTAFSRVMVEMRNAVDSGGAKLEAFAQAAGMTASQFQQAFKKDAGGAITSFVQGLGQMESQGQSTQPVLEKLGLTDIRVSDALRRASGSADLFTNALRDGNRYYEQNNALAQEAAKRYQTTASAIEVAKNNITRRGHRLRFGARAGHRGRRQGDLYRRQ